MFSAVHFFQFLLIKILDPDWIRHPKKLDPDPDQIKYGSETLKVNSQIRIRINRESRIRMRFRNIGVEVPVFRIRIGFNANADTAPDPAFFSNADPDMDPVPDPDPDPGFKWAKIGNNLHLKKIWIKNSIYLYL